MTTTPEQEDELEAAPPAGYPASERVRLAPIVAALDALNAYVDVAQSLDASDHGARVVREVVERIRLSVWEAATTFDEATPTAIGRLVDRSPDTVRYWVRRNYVQARRSGGRLLVDVDSALRHAASL